MAQDDRVPGTGSDTSDSRDLLSGPRARTSPASRGRHDIVENEHTSFFWPEVDDLLTNDFSGEMLAEVRHEVAGTPPPPPPQPPADPFALPVSGPPPFPGEAPAPNYGPLSVAPDLRLGGTLPDASARLPPGAASGDGWDPRATIAAPHGAAPLHDTGAYVDGQPRNGNGAHPNGNGAYPGGNGALLNGNGAYPQGNGAYPGGNGAYPSGNGVYADDRFDTPAPPAAPPVWDAAPSWDNATVPAPPQGADTVAWADQLPADEPTAALPELRGSRLFDPRPEPAPANPDRFSVGSLFEPEPVPGAEWSEGPGVAVNSARLVSPFDSDGPSVRSLFGSSFDPDVTQSPVRDDARPAGGILSAPVELNHSTIVDPALGPAPGSSFQPDGPGSWYDHENTIDQRGGHNRSSGLLYLEEDGGRAHPAVIRPLDPVGVGGSSFLDSLVDFFDRQRSLLVAAVSLLVVGLGGWLVVTQMFGGDTEVVSGTGNQTSASVGTTPTTEFVPVNPTVVLAGPTTAPSASIGADPSTTTATSGATTTRRRTTSSSTPTTAGSSSTTTTAPSTSASSATTATTASTTTTRPTTTTEAPTTTRPPTTTRLTTTTTRPTTTTEAPTTTTRPTTTTTEDTTTTTEATTTTTTSAPAAPAGGGAAEDLGSPAGGGLPQ